VYNKVSVSDDLYTFESVIPDMYNNLINITKSTDTTLTTSDNINNGMYGEVVESNVGNDEGVNNNMIVMVDRIYNPQKKEYGAINAVFAKYFDNPYYKFYKYSSSGSDITNSVDQLNYTDTKNMWGASIAKFCVKKLDKDASYYRDWFITNVLGI